ncbi:MAG: DUF938 domain-containing protein [Pseudomonadota bacterium]
MDAKLTSPSGLRNLPPLTEALTPRLPAQGLVLELASGPGTHALALSERFPVLTWQPSDVDPAALASIEAWRVETGHANLRTPLRLDLADPDWWRVLPPEDRPAAALAVNVTHISPWTVSQNLLTGLGQLLQPGGYFFLYGPFLQAGVETAPSNLAFDASLRHSNPAWGIRAVEDLDQAAKGAGLRPEERVSLPANNLLLVFRQDSGPDAG